MQDMQVLESLLQTITRDRFNMDFESVSVNNCYILRDEVFENKFFKYINAKAIYSASIFHLAFFKGNINIVPEEQMKDYEKLSIVLYRLNSPYLYIPFEIDYHENLMYQSYYESDHFPLSVWIEEKSLIPAKILFNIIEDILQGLKILESTGHSHLLLTPEEILVPLQWKTNSHVKLYNIGLNSIVFSLLNDKEINEYRHNFVYKTNKPLENKLITNIKEDIFSFAKIISIIIPLCNFENNTDKLSLQNILNNLIKKIDTFSSFDEVILLFNIFFKEENRKFDLPTANIDFSYTDKADFKIPEFNEWKEEAVLEPYIGDEKSDGNTKKTDDEIPIKKKKGKPFLKSLSSIFSRFFSREKKSISVSKTMEEYSNKLEVKNTDSNLRNYNENILLEDSVSGNFSLTKEPNINKISRRTNKIIEEIENSFQKFTENNLDETIENNTYSNLNNIRIEKKVNDSSKPVLSVKNINTANNNKLFADFNNSLLERDYARSYKIIKDSVNRKLGDKSNNIINELENILNDKLKQMDNHYIADFSSDILSKLIKLDTILPMEIDNYTKEEVSYFKNLLEQDSIIIKNQKDLPNKKLNIFLRILEYFKSQYNILTK